MSEVKGGIVIEQLKDYAKRLSDYSGNSGCAEITVWFHRDGSGHKFDINFSAFDSATKSQIKPRYETKDLRDLGAAIVDYIGGNQTDG